jgi:putative ABC transport system permease protein
VSLFADGKRLNKSAPSFVGSTLPPRFENFSAVQGRLPAGAGEVAIDEATAQRYSLKLGQTLRVAGTTSAVNYRIGGIVKFAGSNSFGGAGVAVLTLPQAQRVAAEPGAFDELVVAAESSVSDKELRARIRAVLPSTLDVRTGLQQAQTQTSDLEDQLGFLRTFLLIFAYVALFVGAFIIFNTFSITVAQRTREFGLLRTLGASRRQIMQTVVAEGLLLGVTGAVLGLLAGIGLAPALDQLFKAVGADIPDNGTVLETRTIVVSLLVGIVVTVLAGLAPALRATRVPPIAAMREGIEIPPRQAVTRGRYAVPVLLALIAIRLIAAIISREGTSTIVIIVAIGIVIAAVRLRQRSRGRHYRVVPFLARTIGVLVAWRGVTGRLARENAIRQPGRTMVTAAALTVGIALVAFVAVFADGVKATINQSVDRSFAGNLIVENSQGTEEHGLPAAVVPAVAKVPGVAHVTAVAFTIGRVQGTTSNATLTAIEPSTFAHVYRVEWDKGSDVTLESLDNDGTLVRKSYAKAHHLSLGQTISVLTPSNKHVSLRVLGLVKEDFGLLQSLTISIPLARSAFGLREDALDFVSYAPGASNAQVRPAIDRLLFAQFPQARTRTAAEFKKEQADQINTLLALIYVLLALSVVVSLFGIVNTLILSIYERTRELGMMRAIGTSRRQVRQMIRYESIITALIGGVFGLVIGVVAAVLVAVLFLFGSGYVLSIPIGTLVILLIVAALAGVIAAQLPARRAARLDVLGALAGE